MQRFQHYLRVYREFVATSLAEATSFRAHFMFVMGMQLIFYATSLASVDFLFAHVSNVGIWNREQFLFFVAYMLAIDELHMTVISDGFWNLSHNIRTGLLDFDLLRPLNLLFTIFFRQLRPASLFLMPVSWGLVIYFGIQAKLAWWAWILIPPLLVVSLAVLAALEILISASMFFTVDGLGVNFLRMQFQTMSRWPDFIYAVTARRILTFVLPILLVGNAPVRFLFDPNDSALLLLMIPILLVLLGLNSLVWRFALKHYHSASS